VSDHSRQTVDDLQRDLLDRQRADYRRLQVAAAEVAFERRHGRPAESMDELAAAFLSRTTATVDPTMHLTDREITRARRRP